MSKGRHFGKFSGEECYILSLDWAVNQWCTCLNKRTQSLVLLEVVGVMKWYMQMPTAVGAVGIS